MKRLLVDLTDVALFARRANHVTGIQRVQIQVARSLSKLENVLMFALVGTRAQNLGDLFDQANSASGGIFERLGELGRKPDILPRISGDAGPFKGEVRSWFWPWSKPLDVSSLGLSCGDLMYVGGAFWEGRESMALYERAANSGVTLVAFIHDVIPITHPGFTSGKAVPFFRRFFRLPLHVLTASDYCRQQILQTCDQWRLSKPLSMHVVPLAHEYPGASRGENLSRCSERLMRKIGSRRFVLTVGTVEIRKNHRLLLKVWEDISRVSAEVPLLVVAGAAGWLAQSVIKSLREADSTAPYMFIETPTDEELKWLYNRCLFTVFVSTVEGWGLPVGESLWFNKPCVALRTTSVPEVGGELCDYPSSDMPQEIAQTIGHLLYDANYRTERIQRISKAKLRTWNEVSNEIASYIGSLR